jgi:malonate-semialdehyde dehydrogenase (acetylating) / methylmalonate-semialdehyde dehydrogenase
MVTMEAGRMREIGHWIGGQRQAGTSGRTAPVYDPATGEVTAQVGLADAGEVDAAVSAAAAAFPAWRATSLSKRTDAMFRLRHLLHEHREDLARLVTSEHGKVLDDAAGEVARGLENVDFACGLSTVLKGGFSEQVSSGVDVHDIRQPLGVVAGVTPFNFPVMVPLWMLANAIACGNSFVLKPSERDPSAALLLAELVRDAGIPDGVVNVVQGDREAVDRLLDHPDVRAISFVGSTPVARHVYERGAAAGKRVQALGGAKNHMVVLPDADLDIAADAAVSAGYGSAGERCMAISAVVAVGDVADPLLAAISARIAELRIGPGTDRENQMGPLVTQAHRDRVAGYLESAPAHGAKVLVDGRELPPPAGYEGGFWLGASLLDHVRPGNPAYDDEIFGPVLSVVRVASYEEAIELINANLYGNGTAIFTRDGGAARRFQFEVEAGMVGINVPIPVPVGSFSFGGWKASLFGDTHMYGPDGVRFYTRGKVVTSRWPDPATSHVDLGFPQTH